MGGGGGSALILRVPGGKAVLNGQIDLSGMPGADAPTCCQQVGRGGGGGSGGSLNIEAREVTGLGQLELKGGRGGSGAMGGGGGAGGLLRICYGEAYSFFGSVGIAGGPGGASWLWSEAGQAGGQGQAMVCGLNPPLPTATPVAREGELVAFPQPAADQVCFNLAASAGDEVTLELYNTAYQAVARFRGVCGSDGQAKICESVKPLAPGVYLVRCRAGTRSFGTKKLWVGR
jgi:hypothetical protein